VPSSAREKTVLLRTFQDLPWLPKPNTVEVVVSSQLPPIHLITSAFAFAFSGQSLLFARLAARGWQIPGGHVEPGESPVDAVCRECREEAAALLSDPRLLGYERIHLACPRPPQYRYPYPDSYQVFYVTGVDRLLPFTRSSEVLDKQLFEPAVASKVDWVQQNPELTEAARHMWAEWGDGA